MHEKIFFNGWQDCIRFYNEEIDLIVSTVVGPRILRYGYLDDQNFFYLNADEAGKTSGNDWRIYGGHRLWHAPEAIPRTYHPDNEPVHVTISGNTIVLTQPMEQTTNITKEMEIIFPAKGTAVAITHRLINNGHEPVDLSPWAITVFGPGGMAILPQEPFGEEDDFLLPSRTMVLWQYAQMSDPRWRWGNEYILALHDPELSKAQKIGILNKQGWAAYALGGQVFVKQFAFLDNVNYPDYNSNNELYFNGRLLEIESLAPATAIAPGATAEHTEYWSLTKAKIDYPSPGFSDQIKAVIAGLRPGF